METKKSKIPILIEAIRPFSLTATVIPVMLGAMITLNYYEGNTKWILMIIIALATPLFQIAGNLISTYFDFKTNVDREESISPSRVLVDGLICPKIVLRVGVATLILLFIIGMILVYFRGSTMFIIGLLGIIGACGYSALKYRAMGDLMIYLAFGPLMVFGTFYALTGSFDLLMDSIILSIPIGLLVVGILHANNTRDITSDKEANISTLAMAMGFRMAQKYYYFLIFAAYATVLLFVGLNILPIWTLIVLISLPIAVNNVKIMAMAEPNDPMSIGKVDEMTAQLHLVFGLLLCSGILIEALIS